MLDKLPEELNNYVLSFDNPYKDYYESKVLDYFKSQERYKAVMRQLKSYTLHNVEREVVYFAIDALIG
jgi:hypothetical protein